MPIILLITSCSLNDTVSINPGQSDLELTDQEQWKVFSQLEGDLEAITDAGYSKLCLFELRSIAAYPDSRYIPLLKRYADDGLEIIVYAQEIKAHQNTVNLVQSIGASSVIVYERDLLTFFKKAGIKTLWWSGVAYPPAHADRPQYMGWPDLRNAQVRQDIADWAVQIPEEVDGGLALDYVRWNKVGNGRNAEQVTDLVRRIRKNWDVKGKGILTAAVYPYLGQSPQDGGALSVGQKWNEWLEDGLLDFVYPMAYCSEDIPWLISEWESYEKHKIIPVLSVIEYND